MVIKLLRSAFKQAVRWEVVARNPFDFVTLPKVESKPRDLWTAETIRKALDSCKDTKLYVAMIFAFARSLHVDDNVHIEDEDIAKDNASFYPDDEDEIIWSTTFMIILQKLIAQRVDFRTNYVKRRA